MKHKHPGFTLIETLLYAALTSLLIIVFFTLGWQLIDSSTRDRDVHTLAENEQFMFQKIRSNVETLPASQVWPTIGSSPTLYFTTSTGYEAFYATNGQLFLAPATDANSDGQPDTITTSSQTQLTNSHVTLSNLNFTAQTVNSTPTITLTGNLQSRYQTQALTLTLYLR